MKRNSERKRSTPGNQNACLFINIVILAMVNIRPILFRPARCKQPLDFRLRSYRFDRILISFTLFSLLHDSSYMVKGFPRKEIIHYNLFLFFIFLFSLAYHE